MCTDVYHHGSVIKENMMEKHYNGYEIALLLLLWQLSFLAWP
jgi:hypothetical protein